MRKIVFNSDYSVLICWQVIPAAAAGPFIAGPYLRDITDTSVTIIWETQPQPEANYPMALQRISMNFQLKPRPPPSAGWFSKVSNPGRYITIRLRLGTARPRPVTPITFLKQPTPRASPFVLPSTPIPVPEETGSIWTMAG